MEPSRREFLKTAGASAFCLGVGAPLFLSVPGAFRKGPKALSAGRWAMTVDLAALKDCEGCKACASACHAVHNVPAISDPRHEVKWIWTETFKDVFPDQAEGLPESPRLEQALPVLCNHCLNPSCVQVCPTKATFKRADGVVMMDEHRCIGCRYCMTACPYGARSFNFVDPRPHLAKTDPDFPTRTRGVVEKCNFCEERLAEGGVPACVEACAAKARERGATPVLRFGDFSDPRSDVHEAVRTRHTLRRKAELGNEPSVFYLL